MRKLAIGLAIIILLALLSACSVSPYRVACWTELSSAAPVVLSPEYFVQEVEAMITAIDKHYAHRTLKGITATGLRDLFLPRVREAKDMDELNPILLEMFAYLRNGHANVFTMAMEFGVPIWGTWAEGHLVITRVEEPSLKEAGLARGWVVQQVNGVPALDWLMERSRYVSASTPQASLSGSVDRAFLRYEFEPEIRTYTFVAPSGSVLKKEVLLTTPSQNMRGVIRHPIERRAFGDIGYIAINTMTDGIVARFDRALGDMLNKTALIVDLRFNRGGSSVSGDQMMKRLVQVPTRIWGGRVAHPHPALNYAGNVVVLVGPHTFSAAESFAFDLFDSGRVTVIGMPTAGCSGGGPMLFRTRKGIFFRLPVRGRDISASGLPMEGVGLQPHIHVEPTLLDIVNGEDPVLEEALQYLKARKP